MNANWLRRIFGRRRIHGDLSDEIQAHLDEKTEELIAAGMSPDEAAAAARRAFGNALRVEERSREVWQWPAVDHLLADLRFAVRMLGRSPGFTASVILILALGIGANTAIFTLINSIMLRSLPVRDPQSLVLLKWQAKRHPRVSGYFWGGCEPPILTMAALNKSCSFSYPMYEQIRAQQNVLSQLAGFEGSALLHVSANATVTDAIGQFVSGDFFSMLGLRVALGRLITPSDDVDGAPPVAVLGYQFWQSQFGGDPSVVGKTIEVEDGFATVVGVAPRSFVGLDPGWSRDLWVPFSAAPVLTPDQFKRAPTEFWVEMAARRKPGVSMEQAASALSVIFARTSLSQGIFKPNDAPHIELMGIGRGLLSLRHLYDQQLFIMMGAVGIILLIACANVAGLLLSRAAARQREVAVRFALGASRGRIVRQLLVESLMLALAGGALGILVAYWSAEALAAQISSYSFTQMELHLSPDAHVLAFTFVVAVVVGVAFGLAPALRGTRVDLTPALKASGAQSGALRGGRRFGLGGALVIAQVALSIAVLAGAGLLIRTLVNLDMTKLGFDPNNVLIFWAGPAWAPHVKRPPAAEISALNERLRNRFAALPGVTAASYSWSALVGESGSYDQFRLPNAPEANAPTATSLGIGRNFFATMRIPFVAGRDFMPQDFGAKVQPVPAIISTMMARQLFANDSPLGRRFVSSRGRNLTEYEVVGIVGNTKYGSLRRVVQPAVYIPLTWTYGQFELRTARNPMALIPAIRAAAKDVSSQLVAYGFQRQTEEISTTLYQERLFAWLSSLFAALALILACIGLYGLLAYDVARRTSEIGLRMALGAQPRDISRFVVRRGIALVFAGILIGSGAALGMTRYLQSLLYGVHPADPLTFACVAALLLVIAALACWIPARRAMRVDPMVALRNE